MLALSKFRLIFIAVFMTMYCLVLSADESMGGGNLKFLLTSL